MSESKFAFAPLIELGQDSVISPRSPDVNGLIQGRPMFSSVSIFFDGDEIIADAGTLLWFNGDIIDMSSSMKNGCTASLARTCAGESCCLNTYKGKSGQIGMAAFSNLLPGDLVAFGVSKDKGWILSQGAFVVGSSNIKVSARFAGCCAAAASGEGLFLTKVTLDADDGTGTFFAGGYGGINRHEIVQNQSFMIDNGMFFAAGHKMRINITTVGGWKSCMFSGEGLVMLLHGPATVFTQNRDPSIFCNPNTEGQDSTS